MPSDRSFKVNDWIVEPGLNRLRGPGGRRKLRPQVMELLVYLAGRPGQVVSGDELLTDLWQGRIVTSASIYNTVAELRQALADGDDSRVFVETIPKRGYRLVASVSDVPEQGDPPVGSTAGTRRNGVLALVLAGLAAILLWVFLVDRSVQDSPGAAATPPDSDTFSAERSIAVLPFDDMSPDGDLGWFSDGVTEEILNSLARLPELRVAARTSAFLLRDKQMTIPEIAATLGVGVLVEGSIRRDGDDVRVTYQVIRAADGFHLHSDTIDSKLRDILTVQEQVATRIAEALDVVLDEQKRSSMFSLGTRDVEAYEYYLRGIDRLHDWYATAESESIWSATDWFDRAIEEDRRFGFAYALRAHTFVRLIEGTVSQPASPGRAGEAMVQIRALDEFIANQSKAAALARSPGMRNLFEISLVVFSDDYRRLPALADRFDPRVAEELPDGFDVYLDLAALLLTGRTDAALDFCERRIRRNPLDGLGYNQAWSAAMVSGDRSLAAEYLARAVEDADNVKFTEHNLLLSRIVHQDWAAAAELAGRPGWGIDVMREPIRAWIDAIVGRTAEAGRAAQRLLDQGRSGPYLALALRELGRDDEARAMIGRIDASPAGNLVGLYLFAELGGQLPFELDWMPNFSARMSEANVAPAMLDTRAANVPSARR